MPSLVKKCMVYVDIINNLFPFCHRSQRLCGKNNKYTSLSMPEKSLSILSNNMSNNSTIYN